MNSNEVENALADSPAPRVTEDKLASVIAGETFVHRVVGTLTICVLTLVNGFTVVGKSACVSPENYREDLGEHYAREDAKRQIWALEAYLLKQRQHEKAALRDTFASGPKLDGMAMYAGTKALLAKPMTRGEYNAYRGWDMPAGENPNDKGRVVQYSDGYISWSPLEQFNAAYEAI